MTRGDFVRRWLPVLIWMLVIFAASTDLMSAAQTSRFIGPFLRWLVPDILPATIAAVQIVVRKAAHVTEYAILAGLLWRAMRPVTREVTLGPAIWAFVVAAVYAALDEFHQSFVASRSASPIDVLFDACGAVIGLIIYSVIAKRTVLVHAARSVRAERA